MAYVGVAALMLAMLVIASRLGTARIWKHE
jgi:hypothetical protein